MKATMTLTLSRDARRWRLLPVARPGLVFALLVAVATAGVTYMRTWQDLDLVTLITLPLFLFSATFFISVGMLVDIRLWISNWWALLIGIVLLSLAKTIAGTLAGDDTILLIPRDGVTRSDLVNPIKVRIPGLLQVSAV